MSLVVAFVLWTTMFVLRPFNFWLMLTFSTTLLATLSFFLGWPVIPRAELRWGNLLLGILFAGLLYGIFRAGNQALIVGSRLFPGLLPDRAGNISAVYANLGSLSPKTVGALLFFPVGFGEEVFWRGFVQRRVAEEWSGRAAFVVTTLLYTAVHLPTANPVLILAALTCGLFWGGLYWATGALVPVLISHMIWDPLIFVIWPIR